MELQADVVAPKTLELLKALMSDSLFTDFFLVGGTSIALRLGHRKSVDLDLFSPYDISVEDLYKHLKTRYDFIERYRAKNTLKGESRGIFIDCIGYNYPLVKPLEVKDGIRFASFEDIAAMKLSAIVRNGTRLKDFVDIAYLSSKIDLNAMLSAYRQKFDETNVFIPLKALVYFDEIDFTGEPIELTDGIFDWDAVVIRLQEMIRSPQRVFDFAPLSS